VHVLDVRQQKGLSILIIFEGPALGRLDQFDAIRPRAYGGGGPHCSGIRALVIFKNDKKWTILIFHPNL
jgi:hypothetical protein